MLLLRLHLTTSCGLRLSVAPFIGALFTVEDKLPAGRQQRTWYCEANNISLVYSVNGAYMKLPIDARVNLYEGKCHMLCRRGLINIIYG